MTQLDILSNEEKHRLARKQKEACKEQVLEALSPLKNLGKAIWGYVKSGVKEKTYGALYKKDIIIEKTKEKANDVKEKSVKTIRGVKKGVEDRYTAAKNKVNEIRYAKCQKYIEKDEARIAEIKAKLSNLTSSNIKIEKLEQKASNIERELNKVTETIVNAARKVHELRAKEHKTDEDWVNLARAEREYDLVKEKLLSNQTALRKKLESVIASKDNLIDKETKKLEKELACIQERLERRLEELEKYREALSF